MTIVRKTKPTLRVYGRNATAEERTRFKAFVTADRVRDQQRTASDADTLQVFITKLDKGSFSKPPAGVTYETIHAKARAAKRTAAKAKTQSGTARRLKGAVASAK